MRILSVLLVVCVVCLPVLGRAAMPVAAKQVMTCCKKADTHCSQNSADQKPTGPERSGPGCVMMLSCSLCGFIVHDAVRLTSPGGAMLPKPVARYLIAKVAGHTAENWKPPRDVKYPAP